MSIDEHLQNGVDVNRCISFESAHIYIFNVKLFFLAILMKRQTNKFKMCNESCNETFLMLLYFHTVFIFVKVDVEEPIISVPKLFIV